MKKTPETLTCGSILKLYWQCTEKGTRPEGCQHAHVWHTTVQQQCKAKRPTGCPFCSGTQVCPCNSLAGKEPDGLQFWDYGRNEKVDPSHVGAHSHRKVWWRHVCPFTGDNHSWEATIGQFVQHFRSTKRAPCPICSKLANKERLIKVNKGARLPQPT